MLRKLLSHFTLPLLVLFGTGWGNSSAQLPDKSAGGQTGTFEKLIVATGSVTMDLDLNRLNGVDPAIKESNRNAVRFEVGPNSFFTVRVFNNVLRGPDPGSMGLLPASAANFPEPLRASSDQLVIEKIPSGEPFDLVVRDGKTGFVFFNVEGNVYDYDAAARGLSINNGRLLISEGLANKLGRPADAGAIAGEISIVATMYPIEITTYVNGAAKSSTLPPRSGAAPEGSVPGPDIVVGDMSGLQQFGSAAGQVGLAIGTTSCNNGDQPVHFFQLPNPDHSVVTQNLYRLSGGASNNDRMEQIGQAWVKHTFGASQENACSFGCTPFPDDTQLGVGCSDPYDASQNGSQTDHVGALGSRAWVNPFTGAFPGATPRPESHIGHVHTGTSHRILVNATDLNTTMNTGATYYAEVQYDSPHEYAWCQTHAGQCNMYNNASYRRYNVSGTTSFTFAAAASTVRMTPATGAWTGATSSTIEPDPGVDGRAFVVYKVTGPVAGLWHYEYAIHNQNLDRSVQSFSVPLGCGITVSNVEFHAPPNHPGFPNDGTLGNAGFSNAPWTTDQTSDALTWNSETFAQNQNANAIRFGTMYNFRFDSDRPPQTATATVGFFKTGAPITVDIQGPSPDTSCGPTPSPTATPTATATPTGTPTATPTGTPSATPTGTPGATATPTGTPIPTPTPAQALNISTRLRVQTGDNVAIGGFIVTGTEAKKVVVRGIGPSLVSGGLTDFLADPVLQLRGSDGGLLFMNDNWKDTQRSEIEGTAYQPTDDRESVIVATLQPGSYTVILAGKNQTSGVGLVEVYDANMAQASQLANLSTRGFVQTGNNVMIGGFILGGNSANARVAVRGRGPSLSQSGLSNLLADPTLELRDGNGALLISNDNWLDDPVSAAQLTANGLALPDVKESGIYTTLSPGSYTAIVAGKNGGTGLALVEVYSLP